MGKKIFGKCALCGRETELSFEHIPPENALNNPMMMYLMMKDNNKIDPMMMYFMMMNNK